MTNGAEVYVALDQQDFRDIVHGHEIKKFAKTRSGDTVVVKLVLSDIGFQIMLSEINDAMQR